MFEMVGTFVTGHGWSPFGETLGGASLCSGQAAICGETQSGASAPTTRHPLSRPYSWTSKQAL